METILTRTPTMELWAEATSCTGQDIVFVVGSPRSGTTWLQRLLASHPRVKTGQESHLFSHYLAPQLRRWQRARDIAADPGFRGRSGIGLAGYLNHGEFLTLLRAYVVMIRRAAGVQGGDWFLEKSPSHATVIPEIRTVLPRSRFIHLVRDPRDVVASLVAASRGWGTAWAPGDAGKAAEVWVKHVEAVRKASAELRSDEFIEVRYEDLCVDTQGVLKTLEAFLALEWDEGEITQAVETNRVDEMKRGGGTRIPIFGQYLREQGDVAVEPEGFVRQARPGTGKEELSLRNKIKIWRKVHPTMKALGYSWKLADWM